MHKTYILYRIINLVNRKFYIGKTYTTLDQRWGVHKSHAKHGEKYTKNGKKSIGMTHLYKSMRKYGIDKFEIRQIDQTHDFKHCCFLEQFYIKYYEAIDKKYGYNETINGYGDGLDFISEESRAKFRLNTYTKKMQAHDGVFWDKSRNKWGIRFQFSDIQIMKRCEKKEDAEFIRDILSIFFWKESAILIHPEKLEEYKSMDIELIVNNLRKKKTVKSNFLGVVEQHGIFMARAPKGKERIYIGMYDSEEGAARARDKVVYYLHGLSKKMNFPQEVNDSYIEEGKKIYELYSNPDRQMFIKGGKTSKYNGVCKRSPYTWEMSIKVKEGRIREVYVSEEDAGRAYDYYCKKYNINMNKLNFGGEEIQVKPTEKILDKKSSKSKVLV